MTKLWHLILDLTYVFSLFAIGVLGVDVLALGVDVLAAFRGIFSLFKTLE